MLRGTTIHSSRLTISLLRDRAANVARWFSSSGSSSSSKSVSSQKAKEALHKDVVEMMGKKPIVAPPPLPPASTVTPKPEADVPSGMWAQIQSNRQLNQRFNQGLMNSVLAFSVLVLSAQTFKSGSEKRKAEADFKRAQRLAEQRLDALQSVLDDEFVEETASQMFQESTRISVPNSSGWFGSRGSTKSQLTDNGADEELQARLEYIVRKELYRKIGDVSFEDTAARTAFENKLSSAEAVVNDEDVSSSDSQSVPAKTAQVFTM